MGLKTLGDSEIVDEALRKAYVSGQANVKVVLRARALKEMGIDVSDWTFVIEGATGTVVVNAVSTGETVGEIVLGNFSSAKISATLRAETQRTPIYESNLGGIRVYAAAATTSSRT